MVETLYQDGKFAIRYNRAFDMYAIKTPKGVISIPEEVLEALKSHKGLTKKVNELLNTDKLQKK
jgi:hypothetical protein